MKLLAILAVFVGFQSAFAGGAGEPILTKMTSAGARPPKYRNSRTVEVMPMGDVRITTEKGLKETVTNKGPLSPEKMRAITACIANLKSVKAVKYPNCAGSGLTSYYVGNKMVSIRSCGEVSTSEGACVSSMIKILDQL